MQGQTLWICEVYLLLFNCLKTSFQVPQARNYIAEELKANVIF